MIGLSQEQAAIELFVCQADFKALEAQYLPHSELATACEQPEPLQAFAGAASRPWNGGQLEAPTPEGGFHSA